MPRAGVLGLGSSPSTTCRSVRQTPQAQTFRRIWPGPGRRSGSSVHSSGTPTAFRTIACIAFPPSLPPPTVLSSRDQPCLLAATRAALMLIEYRQRDRARHRLVPCVVRMQVVTAVPFGQHPRRMAGVAHRSIEIDNPVHLSACADPQIDRLPLLLVFVAKIPRRVRCVEFK